MAEAKAATLFYLTVPAAEITLFLYRRSTAVIITDTNSKAGTYVNDKKLKKPRKLFPAMWITMGTSRFALRRVSEGTVIQTKKKIKQPKISNKKAPSPCRTIGLNECNSSIAYSTMLPL